VEKRLARESKRPVIEERAHEVALAT